MISFNNFFSEVACILAIAKGIGSLALWLRQPLTMAFIIVGIVVGPAGLGLGTATDEVELLAELGIALLLFVVWFKLDPYEIRAVGPVDLVTGIEKILVTGGVGDFIAINLNFKPITAFYEVGRSLQGDL